MQVVAVDPIEVMFLSCVHIVPQVHSSTCDRVIKVVMGLGLAE